ncbi:MAG: LytR C-terminal domain-containing protein [Gemmatimonadota bacterium]
MILGRMVGCLETVGIAVLALVLGAFAASTLMRHLDGEETAAPEPGVGDTAPPVSRTRIRVEVRNGAGLPGAAERVTELLRRRGFDVVDFGNADRFDHERTHVLDRVGNAGYAREVATILQGVPIELAPDSSLYLDVTVMIGRDLEEVMERADPEAARKPGWRLRIERALNWARERFPWS